LLRSIWLTEALQEVPFEGQSGLSGTRIAFIICWSVIFYFSHRYGGVVAKR
jgi:hypothetical protein